MKKGVTKFNRLLSSLLNELCDAVPQEPLLMTARDLVGNLIHVDADDDTFLVKFAGLVSNLFDYVITQNPDVIKRMAKVDSSIPKEDLLRVYEALSETDRGVAWQYLARLFNAAKKTRPDLFDEREFDFSALQKRAEELAVADEGEDIVQSSFVEIVNEYKRRIGVEVHDGGFAVLMAELSKEISLDTAQKFVMDPQAAARDAGLPFVEDATELLKGDDAESLVQMAQQVCTLFAAQRMMDPATLKKMSGLAKKVCKSVRSGDMDLSNPMELLSNLGSAGLGSEIMSLFSSVG